MTVCYYLAIVAVWDWHEHWKQVRWLREVYFKRIALFCGSWLSLNDFCYI